MRKEYRKAVRALFTEGMADLDPGFEGPDDAEPIDVDEGIVRLGGLASRRDLWWPLPDPSLDRPGDLGALRQSLEPLPPETAIEHARPPVAEALEVVCRHAIPFLHAWAVARGGSGFEERGNR